MKINNLKVNGCATPIGYDYGYLSFSWDAIGESTEDIISQQVLIATDPTFKEILKIIDSENHCNIISVDSDFLAPRTRYHWKVVARTKNGTVENTSFFETGKLEEDWEADWLSYAENAIDSVIFQKNFSLSKRVKTARLYCCGYGLYEASLNGVKVTEEVLLPGYHSYDLLNQYQTFDITELLQSENRFSFVTGNGWYKGRFVFDGGYENIYGDKQKMIAEVIIVFEDGTSTRIVSDDSWQVTTSYIKENSIYDGEILDYQSELESLTLTVLSGSKELLTERSNPPILKQKVIMPKKTFIDKNQQIILDFGQIVTGWLEGLVASEQPIRFRFSELLQDGAFYQENLRTAKQEFTILSQNECRYVRPHFTFFGFRYVEVTGLTLAQAAELKAYVIYSEMEELFQFESSDEKLNQLVENIKWSQKDNFLDIPTDCPQRDERMGWTGDVTVFANASCYNLDTRSFYTNYLRNLALEQERLSGSVPFFVPFPKIPPHENINPFLVTDGAAVWGDVATVLPYQLFRHYKDLGLLKETTKVMEAWVSYLHKKDAENGNRHLWDFDRQLGDWLALDNGNPQNPIGATDPNLIASIYYYKSVGYLAEVLLVLKDDKALKYQLLAEDIHKAILRRYYLKDQLLLEPLTQTALALLLRNNLYPSAVAREQLRQNLAESLAENNNYLNTGFIGTPELTHALAENELSELAYTLLLNEDCPSWLYEVNQGATTVWERWNSILPNGKISGTEMNSLNHYAYGAVQDFIIEKVIGLSHTTEISHSLRLQLKPYFDNRLSWVKGSLKTANGLIEISWKWKNRYSIELEVKIPHNTELLYINSEGHEQLLYSGQTILEVKINE